MSQTQPASRSFGAAATAPAGAKFFDCDTPLRPAAIAAFKAEFTGAGRYLSRAMGQSPGDLSQSEARLLLTSGLAIVPVQHVPSDGWMPTAAKGASYGRAAAFNADEVGCPAGVNIWLDLEGVSADADPDDVVDYCEAWFEAVTLKGYVSALYVGDRPGLDALALYHRLSVKHYWRSGSRSAPMPAVRGAQIIQRIANQVLAGVGYDSNTIQPDNLKDLPTWWVA